MAKTTSPSANYLGPLLGYVVPYKFLNVGMFRHDINILENLHSAAQVSTHGLGTQ